MCDYILHVKYNDLSSKNIFFYTLDHQKRMNIGDPQMFLIFAAYSTVGA
jgi:hypothetical protein